MKLELSLLLVLAIGSGAAPGAQAGNSPNPPNIVIVLADDLGWGDVGYHGSDIRTPNLDRLAAEGVRLEQFYAAPICTPTRAALMTGRYPFRYGLQTGVLDPWDRVGLPLRERTLSQALKEGGYRTAIVGKWHLGHGERALLPTQRGFDRQYGPYIFANYFTHRLNLPSSWGETLDWHRNDRPVREVGYTTHLFAREAIGIIEEHEPTRPLFLYLPFTAPHATLEAPQSEVKKYARVEDPRRRLYAAVVTIMDDAIGQIWNALERRGMTENTLLFFSSDNGGALEWGASNGLLRGGKGMLYEGGVRVPAFAHWAGVLPAGTVVDEPLHVVDLYPTLLGQAGISLDQALPIDGRDMWGTVSQGRPSPHEEILLGVGERRGSVRAGDWKMVTQRRWRGLRQQTELFNLDEDPHEQRDIAENHPSRVGELMDTLERYRAEAAPVLPRPRSRFGYRCPAALGAGSSPACTHALVSYLEGFWEWMRGTLAKLLLFAAE